MSSLSRRNFLTLGGAGAGTLMLPWARPAAADVVTGEPHYFLFIMLGGGADASYFYDARPLSMTAAGRIQNYVGKEPTLVEGRNGTSCRASRLVQPLSRLRDRFSVLNGVFMTPSFDGHLQNVNFLMTGEPFGGESFVPHLNGPATGRAPALLDAIAPTHQLLSNLTNNANVVSLRPQSIASLAQQLRNVAPVAPGDELMDFVQGRIAANASGSGRLAVGAGKMLSGLAQSGEMHRRLAQLQRPDPAWAVEDQSVSLMAQCFRLGIARSAVYLLPEDFDVHSAELARKQPSMFATAMDRLVTLFDGLIETPYDSKRSLLDVTTVMVASEFSRTLRSPDAPIDNTGTNHNPFCNTVLLAGKGIRPGMVIGASDLADERAVASPAHIALDPRLEKAMGRPFDFKTLQPRNDRPQSFDIRDYLTIGSVVNTVYSMFDVPQERWRSIGRDLPKAPALQGLLS